MKTKLFTLLLALVASVGTMFAQSGTCGANLTWSLSNGTLTISGTGSMYNYDYETTEWVFIAPAPWYDYRSKINSVIIEQGVSNIGSSAFRWCENLTYVRLPNSITNIEKYAFCNCKNLTNIEMSNSVSNIGELAFAYCSFYNITIPTTMISIGERAFAYNSNLEKITIPINVKKIDRDAFIECSGLTSITWNARNCQIKLYYSSSFFYGLTATITSFVFGEDVEVIPANLCCGLSKIKSITIPSKVSDIGDYALGCKNLRNVYNYASTPQEINALVFNDVDVPNCKLYVPKGSVELYKDEPYWRDFYKILPLDETAIENVTNQSSSTDKVMRDGQILIQKGDKTYTVTGQEVK